MDLEVFTKRNRKLQSRDETSKEKENKNISWVFCSI